MLEVLGVLGGTGASNKRHWVVLLDWRCGAVRRRCVAGVVVLVAVYMTCRTMKQNKVGVWPDTFDLGRKEDGQKAACLPRTPDKTEP